MAGKKFDKVKTRLDLISPEAIEGLGRVLTHGAIKYGDNNWREGIEWHRVYGATLRHLNAFWGGEDIDADSGLPHLYHAFCEIMFLIEFAKTHRELDDRPTHPATPNSTPDSTEPLSKDKMIDILYGSLASPAPTAEPSNSETHTPSLAPTSESPEPDPSLLDSGCSPAHR